MWNALEEFWDLTSEKLVLLKLIEKGSNLFFQLRPKVFTTIFQHTFRRFQGSVASMSWKTFSKKSRLYFPVQILNFPSLGQYALILVQPLFSPMLQERVSCWTGLIELLYEPWNIAFTVLWVKSKFKRTSQFFFIESGASLKNELTLRLKLFPRLPDGWMGTIWRNQKNSLVMRIFLNDTIERSVLP